MNSLPDMALRTLVETRGLPSDSTCVLEADPGKVDIIRRKPGILFVSLQVGSLFFLTIISNFFIFVSDYCH